MINQRLGPSARSVTLNNIFARFISNPNDSNNNRELRNVERLFNENSDDINKSDETGRFPGDNLTGNVIETVERGYPSYASDVQSNTSI